MIAWLCCFAPFEKPRYAICVMVQGGHHGGSVAGPVAAHILEQVISMDQGNYNVELTSLAPAHNPNPFNKIEALIDYKDAKNITINNEEEGADTHDPGAKVEMGGNGASPDIRAEADARGKVQKGKMAATPKPVDNRSFLQKFFGVKSSAPNPPRPAGPPSRGAH
jgi:penicillin-binding protein 2